MFYYLTERDGTAGVSTDIYQFNIWSLSSVIKCDYRSPHQFICCVPAARPHFLPHRLLSSSRWCVVRTAPSWSSRTGLCWPAGRAATAVWGRATLTTCTCSPWSQRFKVPLKYLLFLPNRLVDDGWRWITVCVFERKMCLHVCPLMTLGYLIDSYWCNQIRRYRFEWRVHIFEFHIHLKMWCYGPDTLKHQLAPTDFILKVQMQNYWVDINLKYWFNMH